MSARCSGREARERGRPGYPSGMTEPEHTEPERPGSAERPADREDLDDRLAGDSREVPDAEDVSEEAGAVEPPD
ncbi:Uncharacterised protein [Nocardia farcinica]|uniref:Uncharacterized protein n=2 Tax=Nocardiaceae TaxID=85025 RepID=A0A449GHA6_NOCFR|nr:Uncharacterised protein [Nocardia farcinica]VFA91830.1 Uncharacterised protein [Nocardia farcinica]